MNTMALIDKIAADLARRPGFGRTRTNRLGAVTGRPENALGGFKSYDDMKREMAAERAIIMGRRRTVFQPPVAADGITVPSLPLRLAHGAHNG